MAWSNRRTSRHRVAHTHNRLLLLAEFQYGLAFTLEYLPGAVNTMADAGLRAWIQLILYGATGLTSRSHGLRYT